MHFTVALLSATAFLTVVHAHGCITNVKGANGVNGAAFGIDQTTPRDGSRARPFQQDTSIIRDSDIRRGRTSACGRTRLNGDNDIAANLAAASNAGLPSADANGQVEMTLHQVNQDGAGPFTCDVNTDGTGQDFQPMEVVTNVPGIRGLSRAKATDFPLVAQMPAGTQCTGGPDGNACIVRCRNPARAGPFGGCVAVTMGDGAAAGNATATEDSTAGGTAAANSTTTATDDSTADGAAAQAEAAEAAAEDDGDAGGAAGGLKSFLGGLGGGAGGGIGDFLGNLGQRRERKRVVSSRIVSRQLAGRWI